MPQSVGANAVPALQHLTQRPKSLPPNVLIAADYKSGNLEDWPVVTYGTENHPRTLAKGIGLKQPIGMAGDGDELVIADFSQIALFNVTTMQVSYLSDSDGFPVDVTVGKTGSVYALNINSQGTSTNVVEYRHGSKNPRKLSCALMQQGEELAVDNEGDVFINGMNSNGEILLAEVPSGSKRCQLLSLRVEEGYLAGLAVDPKTDDLLGMDNPGVCAGPPEGRLTIYSKPYQAKTAVERDLGGICTSGLRLNADSTDAFYGDACYCPDGSLIREAAYPSGKHVADYSGGQPIGFTTIPNSLPN